ncbi:MAG: hypothetical protein Q7R90_04810 [bacterium]|nr:hypothetical protein [bacterium]
MDNFDFGSVPKIICEGTAMGMNKNFISIAIKAGQGVTAFSMIPEDAKKIAAGLAKTLELYEVSYGSIPDSNRPVPSPVDLSDSGSKDEGKSKS